MSSNLFIVLSLMVFVGCSSSGKSDILGPAGGTQDDIPDEFPLEKTEAPKAFRDKSDFYGLKNLAAANLNVVDLNGDHYSDLVVIPSFYAQPVFYYFDVQSKKFRRGESPFENSVKASFLQFVELNNDKVIDVVVGVLNQKTELSREPLKIFMGKLEQGRLTFGKPIELKMPLANAGVGLIDFDLDGYLDLYVGNWFKMKKNNPFPAPDYLFRNMKGKEFRDVTNLLLGEWAKSPDGAMFTQATPTYGVQVCDMDQNGYPDILTSSTNRFDNKLWMNRYRFSTKTRFFEQQGRLSGFSADREGLINKQGGGRTFGLACADYNNDGIMDVFLGELNHNYDNSGVDRSSILTGRTFKYPPRFYRTEYFSDSFDPQWHEADRRGVWADLNNDGLLDLIVDNSGYPPHSKLIYFEQSKNHSFTNKASELGIDLVNPMSTVILDINRDGKLDIMTVQSPIRDELIKPRIFIFENNLDLEKRKSLRFFLRGERSNLMGINATVILKVKGQNGEIKSRIQNVAYSYGAIPPQNEEGIHFGLDVGETLDSVTVRWPFSGSKNKARNYLEKKYVINFDHENLISITLCEDGNYLLGRRNCL